MKPTIGRIVIYRTDGRNGLIYDLPAIITVTKDTHPGDYPDGRLNPLPVPESEDHVHLTVFTPGGFGTSILPSGPEWQTEVAGTKIDIPVANPSSDLFPDSKQLVPGSGTYVELNVPFFFPDTDSKHEFLDIPSRSWRWPERV
jgi:hypothetical protein